MTDIQRLLDIMASLRNPDGGCPWDVAQDFRTIAPYTIEEAYEVAEAIENEDWAALKSELGDLLFTLAMLARRMRIEPEAALQRTNQKFRRRFTWIERELERRGLRLEQTGLELLEQLWQKAKTQT